MRRRQLAGCVLALGLMAASCAPAGRYEARPTPRTSPSPRPADQPYRPWPIPADYAWMPPDPAAMDPEVIGIEFVHEETNPQEWEQLRSFWNLRQVPRAPQAAALLGLPPVLQGGVAAATMPVVTIKIPSGLDPIGPEQLPAANPPTVAKWELGKLLFFDDSYLLPEGANLSCASCHRPALGYARSFPEPGSGQPDTPTLVNVVYHKHLFWDGRASALEEVVQRVLEDERPPRIGEPAKPHVWSGVIARLRASADYDRRFRRVFGTPPTQDAVGKALATYLRTILSGNSLQDRAEQSRRRRNGATLEPADYEKFLDEAAIRSVLLEAPGKDELPPKDEVARQLHAGYTLFYGKGLCSRCHAGRNFTDNGFHNLGVGQPAGIKYEPGKEPGRFAALPIGRKDPLMIGAYKTPTLRALLGTRPYFHDGSRFDLFDVVAFHVQGSRIANPYLDPLLRDPQNPLHRRDLGLKEDEVRALVMFLKALDGDPIDPAVAEPDRWPEGTGPNRRK
ncbi:MAG TPA: cytochrome c peroxidase [Gemmataceae bacterium]|nr:cytochrome c peroxidase [Gemmataceae bacterium]